MILNVNKLTFGGAMRMGDIVACANVVAHFRQSQNNDEIKFYLGPDSCQSTAYVQEFKTWMIKNTDYFSEQPGEITLPWQRVNLWDYRDISGDLVEIENNFDMEPKVVICPLFDAQYNQYRNWPSSVLDSILEYCATTYYDCRGVIVSAEKIEIPNFTCCTDLTQGLHEIMSAKAYFGGDTGLSHFVGALDKGPHPYYYTSSRGLLHTTPINWYTNKKGTMRTYWLDFERTVWQ